VKVAVGVGVNVRVGITVKVAVGEYAGSRVAVGVGLAKNVPHADIKLTESTSKGRIFGNEALILLDPSIA